MIKIGIVGGTGYTGVELLRLLAVHPEARVAGDHVARRGGHAGRRHVPEPARPTLRPRLHRSRRRRLSSVATSCSSPRRTASRWRRRASSSAPASRSSTSPPTSGSRTRPSSRGGTRCRTPARTCSPNRCTACPRCNRDAIRKARIVGNPGCYPTAMQLGFLPLVEAGIVDVAHLIADASPASRAPAARPSSACCFARRPTTSRPTTLGGHRHHPEIVQGLNGRSKTPVTRRVHAAPGADDPRHPRHAVRAL